MNIQIEKSKIQFFGKLAGSNSNKFNRIAKLANRYNDLKAKFDRYMDTNNFTERSLCALACRIMLETGIRIGNETSALGYMSTRKFKDNEFVETFGLTTLQKRHVKPNCKSVTFKFVGKRQIAHEIVIKDIVIVEAIKKLHLQAESKKDWLFPITDSDVRKFVNKYVGSQFMPKDFRTLKANIEAMQYFQTVISKRDYPQRKSEFNAEKREIAEHVADVLGNTVGIAKKSYIDDRVWGYIENKRWT